MLTTSEKMVLHELLGCYAEELRIGMYREPKTKLEFLADLKTADHIEAIGEIRSVLVYDF